MIWHSRSELEEEGPPSRKELFWAIAATPLLLFQIFSWSHRIVRGFSGEPLVISRLFEISALRLDASWHFAAGIAMYVIFIAFALLLLWACSLQFQRWSHWKHRR